MSNKIVPKISVSCELNGKALQLEGHSMERLLDVLRNEAGLTGSKEGCGEGECGACAVLINGKLVNSCLIPLAQVQGAKIETIENSVNDQLLQTIQQSFVECGGAQCGICTPGMLMSSLALLKDKPNPTMDDLKFALAGNLCRCTGYMKIFDSVMAAAKKLSPNPTTSHAHSGEIL